MDKIINYDSNPETLRDWRNRVVYCADDEDGNKHVSDADLLARSVASEHCDFNIDKIYLDAYQQIATPGGDRYPDAQTALNNNMFKGALVVNYMGHGGPVGWAQERVLGLTDIGDWSNFNSLPLFITATCTFAGYDEPSSTSGGEMAILNPNGGAIALFTTVRAVYANANLNLAQSVFDTIFQEVEGLHGIGEVLRIAKNNTTAGVENTRKFTLLGDPAMELALPKQNIETLTINNHDVSDGIPDTIQALQQVTITGRVTDFNGNFLSSFNGKVYPTIFDKAKTQKTLAQDGGSDTMAFSLQKNIIFKGVASVTNGLFTFTFIVPKDIDYSYGFGKISYYAEDGNSLDARGSYKNIVIGGANPNAVEDNVGPLVEVYMNTEEFISGGLTDENPTLLVKLSDDYGINVVGNSIGHDLTGVLDQNTQNSYILNDFYESALDDYTKGEVRYPLHDLEEGLHYIKVKAWDISNNSGEGDTEFVVASSGQAALTHVLNYPNPFTTNTNFQFEHNLPAQDLDIQIHVFTVSGKLVKTIDERVFTDGYFINDIQWDGRDDYGNDLGRGVYLYKVKIRSANNSDLSASSESDFEKLVILK